jgi:hypothetical protein
MGTKFLKTKIVVSIVLSLCFTCFAAASGYVLNDIPESKQLTLLAGSCGGYTDCKLNSQKCYTVPACSVVGWNCESGAYVCFDSTRGHSCQSGGVAPDCTTLSAYSCSPKRMLTGYCNGSTCVVSGATYGACGTSVGRCQN